MSSATQIPLRPQSRSHRQSERSIARALCLVIFDVMNVCRRAPIVRNSPRSHSSTGAVTPTFASDGLEPCKAKLGYGDAEILAHRAIAHDLLGHPTVQLTTEQALLNPVEGRNVPKSRRAARVGPLVAVLFHHAFEKSLGHRGPVQTTRNCEEDVLDHVQLGAGRVDSTESELTLFRKRDQALLNFFELLCFALDEFHHAPAVGYEPTQVLSIHQVEPIFRGDPHLTLPVRSARRNRSSALPVRHKRSVA